jgi:A/G-specific adenine glycosylase
MRAGQKVIMPKNKNLTKKQISDFQHGVLKYYQNQGRHNLPWRLTHNPYEILVSELMLQQTQVDRVIPKYLSWIEQFPDTRTLAEASFRTILYTWQGLGYNRRAKYLQQVAQIVERQYNGELPRDKKELLSLPGIGTYTASAVCVFAFDEREVFIETNVRTVFLHHFFPKRKNILDREILSLVGQSLPEKKVRDWYYALMDYGTWLKKTYPNPSRRSAHHTKQNRFNGSDRHVRGQILRLLTNTAELTLAELNETINIDAMRLGGILAKLEKDTLITKSPKGYQLFE